MLFNRGEYILNAFNLKVFKKPLPKTESKADAEQCIVSFSLSLSRISSWQAMVLILLTMKVICQNICTALPSGTYRSCSTG